MKSEIIQNGKSNIFYREYDSIQDLYNDSKTAQVNKEVFKKQDSINGSLSFTGTKNFAEAEDLLLNGWSEGAKKLTSKLKVANAQMQSKEVKRAIFDIVGFQASVPRYLQGIPTNMVNKKTVKQKQKVITLVKSIAYAAKITTNQIMEDSVKFLQIIQDIEAKGIRVNAFVSFHSIVDNEEMHIRVPVKKANERMNISKMSFPLMHPSFLRRIIFRTMEIEMRVKNNWAWGYGRPASISEFKPCLKENEYFIPVMVSEAQAVKIVSEIK